MRAEKQLLLDEIKDLIEENASFVVMQYIALKANTATDFRRRIAEMDGKVEVVKKRLLVKAAQQAGIQLDLQELPGHIGLVFAGHDPVQTTKAVYKLKKETNNAVDVLGGRFEGQLYNADDVEKLSKLPGRDEMRAQLLGMFEAPQAQTIAVMQSLLCSVLYCLENKIEK